VRWITTPVSGSDGAGAPATSKALLFVFALAAAIVLPSLTYLYRLTQSESWTERH
jgi:cytochrome d ubiquinol oxidase subunit II